MPRGRHRHSPPLHRLLPPSAIAGVSVVCALGPWVFSEATVLRALAAAAAATAVVGAVVMRRWDAQAGKRVAELTRARASDEWRSEERIAELETDLEESRELRAKLEQRLRAKRAELAGLRNEHAALLRRYATAETERASALEGRRLLEIEAAVPSSSPALPPARSAEPQPQPEAADDERQLAYAVFSPQGARLYRRALTALAALGREAGEAADTDTGAGTGGEAAGPASAEAADAQAGAVAEAGSVAKGEDAGESAGARAAGGAAAGVSGGVPQGRTDGASAGNAAARDEDPVSRVAGEAVPAAAPPSAGHFTVPTAVAVVPAAPARRPVVEGGFDFFGTQKAAPKPVPALDAVQNEDLADVVGQEALAVHKAESEAEFKDPQAHGIGQVIDLTAHDETEQIDVQGLRSAAS